MEMGKRRYQEPCMKMVKLRQQLFLAASQGGEAERNDYGSATRQTWGRSNGVKADRNLNVWDEDWSEK